MIHLNLFALLLTAFYSIIVIGYQLWFLWDSRLKYRNFASFFESAMIEILVSPITFVWFLVNSYRSSEDGNKITYIYNPILITAIISLLLGFIFLCIHRDQLLQYKSYKYCVYISRFITGIPLLFSPFSSFLLFLFLMEKLTFRLS